jgi:hypothetical protein
MPVVKVLIAVSAGIYRILFRFEYFIQFFSSSHLKISFDIFPPCPSTATTQSTTKAPTQPTTTKSTTTKTTTTRDPNDTRPRIT